MNMPKITQKIGKNAKKLFRNIRNYLFSFWINVLPQMKLKLFWKTRLDPLRFFEIRRI